MSVFFFSFFLPEQSSSTLYKYIRLKFAGRRTCLCLKRIFLKKLRISATLNLDEAKLSTNTASTLVWHYCTLLLDVTTAIWCVVTAGGGTS